MNRILWILIGCLMLTTTHAVSFDCTKAKTKVEVAICQNQGLSNADSILDKAFKTVRDNYDEVNQKSLVEGQRKWLKLRGVACITKNHPNEGEVLQNCLLSVYKERQGELQDELEIQGKNKKVGINSTADIEKILDNELLDSSGYEQEMRPDGDYDEIEEFRPKTCREFYTLNAGIWKYGGDNIGSNAYMYAINSCAFEIFAANNYANESNKANEVNFDDVTKYSTEFDCLVGGECEYENDNHVKTFGMVADIGKIKIIHNEKILGKFDDNTLVIGKNQFQFHGMHYSYTLSPQGNYTNKGHRKEALLSLGYYSLTGSMHGSILVVAYYDPDAKAIRPAMISQKSRLRLLPDED